MAVSVTTGAKFAAAIARPLFSTPLKGRAEASYASRSTYAVALDGQRFLFARYAEAGSNLSSVTVVLGWDAAVKR